MTRIVNSLTDNLSGFNQAGPLTANTQMPNDYSGLYELLYNLYRNDSPLYAGDSSRRLRTVVNRSVEFYASKILPGDKITVVAANGKAELKDALNAILKMSNFQGNKPTMLRDFALYGDQFTRVRGEGDKVYLEDISPFYVTDFGEDSRGFLTYIRIDIPTLEDLVTRNPILYTEYWDLETQTYRSWETHLSPSTPILSFPEPKETIPFSQLGVDFIPIVHTKFKDNGDPRGQSCVYHALDKIGEANRIATRLDDLQFRFNRPLWAESSNMVDKDGRPLPAPPILTGSAGDATTAQAEKEDPLGDIVRLPGMTSLEPLVPDIKYADALAILNALMTELEQDLPELRYYTLTTSQLSGVAIRQLLAGAIDRANEARNNFLSSLSRMLEMGLTIGIFKGIFPATLGSYDNGDFEHSIVVDEMFGETVDERAQTLAVLVGAGVPLAFAMKTVGFSQAEIDEAKQEKADATPPTPPPTPTPTPQQ